MNRGTLGAAVGVAILVGIVAVAFAVFNGGRDVAAVRADMRTELQKKNDVSAAQAKADELQQQINKKVSQSGGQASSLSMDEGVVKKLTVNGSITDSGTLDVVDSTGAIYFRVGPAEVSGGPGASMVSLLVNNKASVGDLDASGIVKGGSLQNAAGSFRAASNGAVKATGLVVNGNSILRNGPWELSLGDGFGVTSASGFMRYGVHYVPGTNNSVVDTTSPVAFQTQAVFANEFHSLNGAGINSFDDQIFHKNLQVVGKSWLNGGAVIGGTVQTTDPNGDLVVVGGKNTSLGGNLTVAGASNLAALTAGATDVQTLKAHQLAELVAGLTVTNGMTSVEALTASGASTLTGTLDVTGASNLAGLTATGLTVSGPSALNGTLGVTGGALTVGTAASGTTVDAGSLMMNMGAADSFTVEDVANPGVPTFKVDNQGNVLVDGTLTVNGSILHNGTKSGAVANLKNPHVSGTLYASAIQGNGGGNVTISAPLVVAPGQATTLGGTLNVVGGTTVNGTLVVTGDTTLANATASGNLTAANGIKLGKGTGVVTVSGASATQAVGFTVGTVVVSPMDDTTGVAWWVTKSGSDITIHCNPAPGSPVAFSYIATVN